MHNRQRSKADFTPKFQPPSGAQRSEVERPRNPELLPPLAICRSHLTQKFKFIEAFASPLRNRAERIFSNMDRQTCFLAQKLVEPPEQCAAACQHEPTIDQVCRKLRRTALQRNTD